MLLVVVCRCCYLCGVCVWDVMKSLWILCCDVRNRLCSMMFEICVGCVFVYVSVSVVFYELLMIF